MISRVFSYWPMVLVVLSLFLLVWIVDSSESFQHCVQNARKHAGTQSVQQRIAVFPMTLSTCRDCLGQFVTENNPAITALATLLIAAFTGTLWHATRGMLQASDAQGAAMERSIAESARAAAAMEQVAKHFADNVETVRERSAQQMRAYVSVLVNAATYQERPRGLRFEGKPAMVNTGHTPARNVGYKARADILPVPLPNDFTFPLPERVNGAASLGPQQHFVMNAIVDGFYDDAAVDAIKRGNDGRALYVWGIVIYRDVFGNDQSTKFCQILTWLPDGRIYGYYTDRHNEAT